MKKTTCNPSTPIIVSMGLFDMIRDIGKNWESVLALYQMYCKHSVIQDTSSVYACDKWMSQQMGWSFNKFKKIKSILKKTALIRLVTKYEEDSHKIEKTYVYVKHERTSSPKSGLLVNKTTSPKNEATGFSNHSLLDIKNALEDNNMREREKESGATPPHNSESHHNTCESMPKIENSASVASVGEKIKTSAEKTESVACVAEKTKTSHTREASHTREEIKLSRDDYEKGMLKRFESVVGLSLAKSLLDADIANNSKRVDWAMQCKYWNDRFDNIAEETAESETEAWKYVAMYCRDYKACNHIHADTRKLLNRWMAKDWKVEYEKIQAFCKSKNALPMMPEYIRYRGEEGGETKFAGWLLSCNDYMRWFKRESSDNGDHSTDESENRPSAGPEGFESLERRRVEGVSKAQEEHDKERGLNLIGRARVILQANMNDQAKKQIIVDALKGYRDGVITLNAFDNDIQALERSDEKCKMDSGRGVGSGVAENGKAVFQAQLEETI